MTADLHRPPFDPERLERARAVLRRHALQQPPSSDPLTNEIRRDLASGRGRGRDLLQIDAYRDHLAERARHLVEQHQQLTEEQRAEVRRHDPPAATGEAEGGHAR